MAGLIAVMVAAGDVEAAAAAPMASPAGPGAPPQLPDAADWQQAGHALAGDAAALGLHLRWGAPWLAALQLRAPLVAAWDGRGGCLLATNALLPPAVLGRWLPPMPPPQRALWLRAALAHELAHCADAQQRATAGPAHGASAAHRVDTVDTAAAAATAAPARAAPAAARAASADAQAAARRSAELLADLAFARTLLVGGGGAGDPPGPPAAERAGLVRQLIALRRRHAAGDPVHDTADGLTCALPVLLAAEPAPAERAGAGHDWLAPLRALHHLCDADGPGATTRLHADAGG